MLFPFRGSRAHNTTPCLSTQAMDAPLNTLKRIIHAIQEPFEPEGSGPHSQEPLINNLIYSKATFLSSRGKKRQERIRGKQRRKGARWSLQV